MYFVFTYTAKGIELTYTFIELNKGIVSDEEICLVTNKYKTLLNEMDKAYRYIISLIDDDNLI